MIIRLRVGMEYVNKSFMSNKELNNHGLPVPLETVERLLFG